MQDDILPTQQDDILPKQQDPKFKKHNRRHDGANTKEDRPWKTTQLTDNNEKHHRRPKSKNTAACWNLIVLRHSVVIPENNKNANRNNKTNRTQAKTARRHNDTNNKDDRISTTSRLHTSKTQDYIIVLKQINTAQSQKRKTTYFQHSKTTYFQSSKTLNSKKHHRRQDGANTKEDRTWKTKQLTDKNEKHHRRPKSTNTAACWNPNRLATFCGHLWKQKKTQIELTKRIERKSNKQYDIIKPHKRTTEDQQHQDYILPKRKTT